MSHLAREHDAINLGQGFPDDPGPADVRRAAADAVLDGVNQYPPMMGLGMQLSVAIVTLAASRPAKAVRIAIGRAECGMLD